MDHISVISQLYLSYIYNALSPPTGSLHCDEPGPASQHATQATPGVARGMRKVRRAGPSDTRALRNYFILGLRSL